MKGKSIGLLLAGGRGKRFGGKKCLSILEERPLILWTYEALKGITDEIWLSVREEGQPEINLVPAQRIFFDKVKDKGPLSALLQALKEIDSKDLLLLTACDQPFLMKPLLEFLCQEALAHPQAEAIVCLDHEGKVLPFPGLYRRKLLPDDERNISSFHRYLRKRKTRFVSPRIWQRVDPEGLSFFNINYQEDLVLAEKILARHRLPSA